MSGVIQTNPKVQFLAADGTPLVGGKLFTYLAGTSTLTTTWQDLNQTTANTNPIILDARGEALVWLDPAIAYKFVLQTSTSVAVWTVDNITGAVPATFYTTLLGPGGAGLVGFSQDETYLADTVGKKLQQLVSVTDAPYNAVGDGVTDDTAAIQSAVTDAREVFFPAGTYKTTTAIAIPAATRVYGVGISSQIHAYGVNGFTIGSAQDHVSIEALALFSYASGGAADPRTYDGVRANGISGGATNSLLCRDLYLQGWDSCINGRYLWSSHFEDISTVNSNYGITLFGQSVNNEISNCNLTVNSGVASVYLPHDGSTIGEGLMVTNSLLSSGTYGIRSGTGFLSLHVSNCVIDLVSDVGLKLVDARSLHCFGNWIYATNKGIEFADLGSSANLNGTIVGNTITVSSSTGTAVSIGSLNSGINIIGGTININGTARGVYVDGQNCFVDGVYFINPGTGKSIYLNNTTGNKIGICTGTATIFGAFANEYTQGTWTPVISADGTGAVTFTAASAVGTYVKNGPLVTLICEYQYTDRGAVGGSYAFMTGVPIARAADGVEPVVFCAINQASFDTKTYQAIFLSSAVIAFQYNNGEGALYTGSPYMLGDSFPTSGTVRFVMTYIAAS